MQMITMVQKPQKAVQKDVEDFPKLTERFNYKKKGYSSMKIKNRPNVQKVGTLFIKYAKVNQVRKAFDIATIENYSTV